MDIGTGAQLVVFIASAIVTVSGASAVIVKVAKNAIRKGFDKELDEKFRSIEDNFNNKLDSLYKKLDNFVRSSTESDAEIKEAMMRDIRNTINEAHKRYVINKKPLDAHTKFTLNELYASYAKFDGNSFVDEQMRDINSTEVA